MGFGSGVAIGTIVNPLIYKGAVEEEGTHDELIDKKGLYAQLWKQQSQGFMGE